jgi:hypothetical protein
MVCTLQNDLMELWSLMHFLMPHVFSSHKEFKDWFSNPLTGMAEGTEGVDAGVVQRVRIFFSVRVVPSTWKPLTSFEGLHSTRCCGFAAA